MDKEIETAVNWWSDKLRGNFKHDNGEEFQSYFATLVKNNLREITEDQIKTFKLILSMLLHNKFSEEGIWDIENPNWGSYHRVISTDYCPDHNLGEALAYANIDNGNLRLPIKTIMWINPGEVKVAEGYGQPSINIL